MGDCVRWPSTFRPWQHLACSHALEGSLKPAHHILHGNITANPKPLNSWHRPRTFDGGRRLCASTSMAQVDPGRCLPSHSQGYCSTHGRPSKLGSREGHQISHHTPKQTTAAGGPSKASKGLQGPPGPAELQEVPGQGLPPPQRSGVSTGVSSGLSDFRGLQGFGGLQGGPPQASGLHFFNTCHFTHQQQKVARPLSASQNLQRTQRKKCCC